MHHHEAAAQHPHPAGKLEPTRLLGNSSTSVVLKVGRPRRIVKSGISSPLRLLSSARQKLSCTGLSCATSITFGEEPFFTVMATFCTPPDDDTATVWRAEKKKYYSTKNAGKLGLPAAGHFFSVMSGLVSSGANRRCRYILIGR